MCRRILLASSLGLVLAAAASPQDADADLKKLQGEWIMASLEYDGQASPEENVKRFRRKVDGAKYTVTITKGDDVQTVKGSFKLDPSKKPKAVDVTTKDGEGNEITILGIYELDGDTHKVCMAPKDQPRPTDFNSSEGSGRTVIVWKRAK